MSAAPLLCVDAPWLLYRSFFALPKKITNSAGEPVNALLGSVNALVDLVQRRKPRAVMICFGAEAAEYRVKAYPGYHASRPPMPDELEAQWEKAPVLFAAFNWHVSDTKDYEADDLLHSYALAETEAGGNTLIFTADRDLFQSVSESVHVLTPRRGGGEPEEVGPQEVQDRYGVTPDFVPDFIALRGDPSDELPGAKGIGDKTAADLLQRHGSLEATIAAAPGERLAVRTALLEQGDQLRVFKDIAILRALDVEPPEDRNTTLADGAEAARKLGMERLAKRLISL